MESNTCNSVSDMAGAVPARIATDVNSAQGISAPNPQYTEQDKRHALITPYVYSPLSGQDRYRVVQLKSGSPSEDIWFSLREYEGDSDVDYHAISYAWESTELTHIIYSSEGSIRITASLHSALQQYRDTDQSRWFWADAICIRQDDPNEKASQVLLIGQIFSRSRLVLVWLGEESETDKEAFEAIAKISEDCWSAIENAHTDDADRESVIEQLSRYLEGTTILHSLTTLLDRSWFSRSWTFQEIYNAKLAWLTCGSLDMEFEHLSRLSLIFFKFSTSGGLNSSSAVSNMIQLSRLYSRELDHVPDQQTSRFLDLIAICRTRNCTVLHDKIYGFLGMTDPSVVLPYHPDYTVPFNRLYLDFTIHTISMTHNLEIFSTCIYAEADKSTPSWVPNWSVQSGATNYIWRQPRVLFRAARDHKLQITPSDNISEFIVDGFIVDQLHCLSEAFGSDKHNDFHLQGDAKMAKKIKVQLDIAQQCSVLAQRATKYSRFDSTSDALYCTLMAVRMFGPEQITPSYLADVRTYIRLLAEMDAGRGDSITNWLGPDAISNIELNLIMICENRRFCLTKEGAIGWVPQAAQEGDVISILFGSSTPVLLRPKGDNFLMIGQCYIHGIMDGEAISEESLGHVQQICLV